MERLVNKTVQNTIVLVLCFMPRKGGLVNENGPPKKCNRPVVNAQEEMKTLPGHTLLPEHTLQDTP